MGNMEHIGDILRGMSGELKEAGVEAVVMREVTESGPGEPHTIDFSKPVKFADECVACELCGEPWCLECNDHYADCSCPGPHSEREE